MSATDLEVFEVVTRRRAGPELFSFMFGCRELKAPVVVVADVCSEGGREGGTGQS